MMKTNRITVRLSEDETKMIEELRCYVKDTYRIEVSAAELLRIALKEYNENRGG